VTLDIAPFAYREVNREGRRLVFRWEEPRDIHRIVLSLANEGRAPRRAEIKVSYWQCHWPQSRATAADLARGAVGGAGWKPRDDWFNGQWAPADVMVKGRGRQVHITFAPLARREFPDLADFDVSYRQTLGLQIDLPEGCAPATQVRIFTDTSLETREISVELGCGFASSPDRPSHNPSSPLMGEDEGGGVAQPPSAVKAWTGGAPVPHLPQGGERGTRGTVHAQGFVGRPPDWDGQVEVYSGVLLDARAPQADDPRLRLRVACAKPGPLSYDQTIITLRAPGLGVSFRPSDLDGGHPIWVPDLGVLVTETARNLRYSPELESSLRTGVSRYDAIAAEPEQSLHRALREQPPKEPMHFIIGCEGARQKFGIAPNGDLFAAVGFIRRAPGADTPRLGWEGNAFALRFGWDGWLPSGRRIERGYLPLLESRFSREAVDVNLTAFATPLKQSILAGPIQGDAPIICMVRLTFVNNGDKPVLISQPFNLMTYERESVSSISRNLAQPAMRERLRAEGSLVRAAAGQEYLRMAIDTGGTGDLVLDGDGLAYRVELPARASHSIVLKVPFLCLLAPDEIAHLQGKDFDTERAEVIRYWEGRLSSAAQISTPDQDITDFYRSHLTHILINDDHEVGSERIIGRVSSFNYGNYSNEAVMQILELDRRGLHEEARRHLATYLHYQGTVGLPGNFQGKDGLFYGSGGYESGGYNQHHGWVLWGLAEHYRYTADRAWLMSIADALIAGCEWVIRERQATKRTDAEGRRVLEYGFLPAGSLEDVTDFCYWLSTNALTCRGLMSAAEALSDAGHPDGERMMREAASYHDHLLAGFREAMTRSPAVRLRDGTYVPHHPSRLYWRGRDFGWIREVLEGSINLTTTVLDPRSQESTWVLKDYEDNRYLDAPYNYPLDNFDAQWFSRGGFSMQPNLLYFLPPYLLRDQIEHFLRAFFNAFAACWRPDIRAMTEHPLPTLADWAGDHFKTSDEAMAAVWLRMMFIQEDADTLYLARGLPRAWLRTGQAVAIRNAATHFGPMSFEMRALDRGARIIARIEPPLRRPPERVVARFPHPEKAPLISATINGQPVATLDPEKEWVISPTLAEPTTLEAHFAVIS
jgi:hypothetical protein